MEHDPYYTPVELSTRDGPRIYCSACKDHARGDIMDFHDCKNLIVEIKDGVIQRTIGQCCCAGPAHGRRKKLWS